MSESAHNEALILPIATVKGEALMNLPEGLYIPPDAMKVLLQAFEGPFDLLLYLIRKEHLDILDIPIAEITRQYMEYIELMEEWSLELAADYLVMAAMLAEIKSRMLLPRPHDVENQEDDPRAALVHRLQEYERYKQAAYALNNLPQEERDIFLAKVDASTLAIEKRLPTVTLAQLAQALWDVLKREEFNIKHMVSLDTLSIREKMSHILTTIQGKEHLLFTHLFNVQEGRFSIVVTFLAMLELLKQNLIEFIQTAPFSPIYLTPKTPKT